jgi:inner membrane protein
MRFPVLSKVAAVGAVVLGLIWGLSEVSSLVSERSARLREAERSVADSLAGSQTVTGPALMRVCTEAWTSVQGEGKDTKRVAEQSVQTVKVLPRKLSIDGSAAIEPRYRGIYKVNGYLMSAKLTADWVDLSALQPKPVHAGGVMSCAPTTLMFALDDTRGVRSAVLEVQGQAVTVEPGTLKVSHARGLHATLPDALLQTAMRGEAPLQVSLRLDLAGTQSLAFTPLGEENQVKLTSNWQHPSFGGRFLPGTRDISQQGFNAQWQVSALASTARTAFAADRSTCTSSEGASVYARGLRDVAAAANVADATNCVETFSVSFIDPVNPYVLSDRATKYGLLFIVLSFVAVGLTEVMRSLRVHPIQYLLVGSALVVFFLLLVSLSEVWSFGAAYAAAATACALLLAYYATHVLAGWRPGALFGAGIGGLYGTLYVLLQLEQNSLVLGSLLLFAVLACVMVVTRKIDWYALLVQVRFASDVVKTPPHPSQDLEAAT